jgi:hypothetical protein
MSTNTTFETVVISQPHCYPWMGHMKLLHISDVFVIRDDVQLEKSSWQTRNRIKGQNGPVFLTIPVYTKGKSDQRIKDVQIDNSVNWRQKHLGVLQSQYAKAPHRNEVIDLLAPLMSQKWELLMDFTMSVTKAICGAIGIQPNFRFATEMELIGNKTECLVNICRQFGAVRYVSANGSAAYIEDQKFIDAGIKLEYLNYNPPEYPQLYGEFLPYMSVLDLLCNVGFAQALEYILKG